MHCKGCLSQKYTLENSLPHSSFCMAQPAPRGVRISPLAGFCVTPPQVPSRRFWQEEGESMTLLAGWKKWASSVQESFLEKGSLAVWRRGSLWCVSGENRG